MTNNRSSFQTELCEKIGAPEPEFVDFTNFQKLYYADEEHLIDHIVSESKSEGIRSQCRIWDKEGKVTLPISNNNEMKLKKESSLYVQIAYAILGNMKYESASGEEASFVESYLETLKTAYEEKKNSNSDGKNINFSSLEWLNYNLMLSYVENGSNVQNWKIFEDFVEKIYGNLKDSSMDFHIEFKSQECFRKEKIYEKLIKSLVDNQAVSAKCGISALMLSWRTKNLWGLMYCLKNLDKSQQLVVDEVRKFIEPKIECVMAEDPGQHNMRFCDQRGLQTWIFQNHGTTKTEGRKPFFETASNVRYLEAQFHKRPAAPLENRPSDADTPTPVPAITDTTAVPLAYQALPMPAFPETKAELLPFHGQSASFPQTPKVGILWESSKGALKLDFNHELESFQQDDCNINFERCWEIKKMMPDPENAGADIKVTEKISKDLSALMCDLLVFRGILFGVFESKNFDDGNFGVATLFEDENEKFKESPTDNWVQKSKLSQKEIVGKTVHDPHFFLKEIKLDGDSLGGKLDDGDANSCEICVPKNCYAKNSWLIAENSDIWSNTESDATESSLSKREESLFRIRNSTLMSARIIKNAQEDQIWADSNDSNNESSGNKDLYLLICWRTGEYTPTYFTIAKYEFTAGKKGTSNIATALELKWQRLLKNNCEAVSPLGSDEYKLWQLASYTNSILDVNAMSNVITQYNSDSAVISIFQKPHNTAENPQSGHVQLGSEDFNIYSNKIIFAENDWSANVNKYEIIGYDCKLEHVICMKKSGSHSLLIPGHPSKLRRYPIGFVYDGLISVLFPSVQDSRVYQDSDIKNFEQKLLREDLGNLMGFYNENEGDASAAIKNSDPKTPMVTLKCVCLKLLGEILHRNPFGVKSEHSKKPDFGKQYLASWPTDRHYFRSELEVCLTQEFLDLLLKFLTDLETPSPADNSQKNNYDILCVFVILPLVGKHMEILWKMRGLPAIISRSLLQKIQDYSSG